MKDILQLRVVLLRRRRSGDAADGTIGRQLANVVASSSPFAHEITQKRGRGLCAAGCSLTGRNVSRRHEPFTRRRTLGFLLRGGQGCSFNRDPCRSQLCCRKGERLRVVAGRWRLQILRLRILTDDAPTWRRSAPRLSDVSTGGKVQRDFVPRIAWASGWATRIDPSRPLLLSKRQPGGLPTMGLADHGLMSRPLARACNGKRSGPRRLVIPRHRVADG